MKKASLKAMILLLLVLASHAAAQFYFLPPYDPEWMRTTPNVVVISTGTSYPMKVDPAGCGWFVLDGANLTAVQSQDIVIWPGKYVAANVKDETPDRIGVNGLNEGPSDWTGTPKMPTPIKLSEQTNMYFDPATGWNTGRGAVETKRCTYHMAGLIYDTDRSLLNSFTQYNASTENDPWMGIRRGIVQPTLARDAKGVAKMQWGGKTGETPAAKWTEGDFNTAFTCTEGKNALVCYDVPFARDSKGLWTFASDYLCSDETLDLKPEFFNSDNTETLVRSLCQGTNRYPMLSFAPGRLNNYNGTWRGVDDLTPLDSRCTYAKCSNCAKPNEAATDQWGTVPPAEPASPFYGTTPVSATWGRPPDNEITKINPSCYEKGLSSTSMTGACGTPYTDGQFARDSKTDPTGAPSIWDWNARDKFMRDRMEPTFKANPNSFFCFETHATFVYEKGQEFYFSGDDDIWVFINDNLVIDLGGCHLASPGYVALDEIGRSGSRWQGSQSVSGVGTKPNYEPLVEGTEYPIDIFFCDRRSNASNIRISTNMYIQQKNGLKVKGDAKGGAGADICVEQSGSGTCASLLGTGGSGTQEMCGTTTDLSEWIEFYIVNRSKTIRYPEDKTKGLSVGEYCQTTANPDELLCFGGVRINMKTGKAWVDNSKVTNLPGTWYLYTKVKDSKNPGGTIEDEKVATITTQTFVGVAYGDIKDGNNLLTNICKQKEITAVTGELVPVCFSSGIQGGNIFETEEVKDIVGRAFKLKTDDFISTPGNFRLEVYWDSLGDSKVDWSTPLVLPAAGEEKQNSGSVPGVLVLWVTGSYDQSLPEVNYKVNVGGKPDDEAVKLKSIIPKLRWIRAAKDTVALKNGYNKYSRWATAGDPESGPFIENGAHVPAWVGEWVTLHLQAYNNITNKVCKTCNFPLSLASADATPPVINDAGQPVTGASLINTQNFKIVNGEAALQIAGKREVSDPSKAKISVRSEYNALADAEWTDLQFQEPPTPFPEKAEIFDDDGDGIGDRLVITYNRLFRRDSLPNAIEVKWDKDTTLNKVLYTINKRTWDGDRKDSVYAAVTTDTAKYNADNVAYWTKYLRNVTDATLRSRSSLSKTEMMGSKDVIELKLGPNKDNPEPSVKFSKDVLTRNENAKLNSWASFKTGRPEKLVNVPLPGSIDDKIPAIVVNARYAAGEVEGCGTSVSPCRDKVVLEISEAIKMDPDAQTATKEEVMNAFAYMLKDLGRNDWKIFPAATASKMKASFANSKMERPSDNGDSVITFTFDRWRAQGETPSETPMPLDSVKFASTAVSAHGFAKNIFVDTKGNKPNPEEDGRQLGGRKPFAPDKLPIGEIDPNYPNHYVDKIKETLNNNDNNNGREYNIFPKDKPIELLPVPPNCDVSCIKMYYPGTVGMVFNPDVSSQISDLEDAYGITISDEDIVFYPKAFFHTNLGLYVADNVFPNGIRCNDAIFPLNEKTNTPSCRANKSKFYIAWDMKDMKGRFVGTGAYVGIYDFYWEVTLNVPSKGLSGPQRQESIERKVEMHGVKRVKLKML